MERPELTDRPNRVDYCLGEGDGSAAVWPATWDRDVDGDGTFDAFGLDFDGDGHADDALADTDGDGHADRLLLDLDDDGRTEASFTDDGTGTWAVGVDGRTAQLRWLGLDGSEHTGGPNVDLDGDGLATDRLVDADRDGRADRALLDGSPARMYVDADGDGRWDVVLSDGDGDGTADGAARA